MADSLKKKICKSAVNFPAPDEKFHIKKNSTNNILYRCELKYPILSLKYTENTPIVGKNVQLKKYKKHKSNPDIIFFFIK